MYEIYALCEPDTGEIRYIGKANDSTKRYRQHLREKRRDYPVYRWIKKLAKDELTPSLVILEKTDDWQEAEIRLISKHRNGNLLNIAEGGNQPECPLHVRQENGRNNCALMREARERTPRAKEMYEIKKNLASALKRGHVSLKTRERMRALALANPEHFGMWANA